MRNLIIVTMVRDHLFRIALPFVTVALLLSSIPAFAHHGHDRDRDRHHEEHRHTYYRPIYIPIIIQTYRQPQRCDTLVVEDRIDGFFSGYREGVAYKLMDGSIWKQTQCFTFDWNCDRPKAHIYRTPCGEYYMRVDGPNQPVNVRRIN